MTGAEALEWIWRIATVIILPALVWIALILRDVDKRLAIVEERVRHIESNDINERQIRRNEHIQSGRYWESSRAQRETDRDHVALLASQVVQLTEAVKQLNSRLDRMEL